MTTNFQPNFNFLPAPQRRLWDELGTVPVEFVLYGGTKAAVVQQRAEAKDYLDMDALLLDGRIDLPTALASACAIYGPTFNPQITLKALSYFGDGNLSRLPQEVQTRLVLAARNVDLDKLPEINS